MFTKCGLVWDDNDRMASPQRVLTPESIRRECEASLRRLGVERIDLYQFHWPDETGTPVEDSWATMTRLIEEGKVRAAGVSNFDVRLLDKCEAIRHVDSLQPPFSLINRAAAERAIPWCASHGTGVICYSPMQSGLLTDGFTADRVSSLASDDWRRRAPEFQQPNLGRNLALRDALGPIAHRYDTSVAAVAIAWTLAWHGVTARDRRRTHAGAGRRMDRRGMDRPHGAGPRRNRGRDPAHRSRRGPRAVRPAARVRRTRPRDERGSC